MIGTEDVAVSRMGDMTVFEPEDPVAGFIFYPGGKVEYTAYSPLMLGIGRAGYPLCAS